jgi:putative acetyltransferase
MKIEIGNETAADVTEIEAVTISAFLNAPHTSHTEQFIVNALREAGKLAVSLVARAGGKVIGHVAVSPVSISDGAAGCVVLGEPRYYSRFGFQVDPGLTLPDVPPEYFQGVSFDSSRPHGTVSYHEAFSAQARFSESECP